jgi:hypothetical protein
MFSQIPLLRSVSQKSEYFTSFKLIEMIVTRLFSLLFNIYFLELRPKEVITQKSNKE